MKRIALFLGSFAAIVALLLTTSVAPAHAIRACAECGDGSGVVSSGPFSCEDQEARLCADFGGIVAGTFKCPCRAGDEVEICHISPGNPANAHTIIVSDRAVAKHVEKHGDTFGPCPCLVKEDCANDTLCDEDICVAGECQHFQVSCSVIACFEDRVCDPTTGLCPEPQPVQCDDGEECNPDSEGVCVPIPPQCGDPAAPTCDGECDQGFDCVLDDSPAGQASPADPTAMCICLDSEF